ncbi:MAG: L-threonylcarbamoyladenylate synthase [Rhodothermales bacterium]
MKTLVTDSPEEAASFVRSGEIVAFPTETVYGLGGDATSEEVVRKIFAAKMRPSDNPLIVHISTRDQVSDLTESVSRSAERLIDRFFPGPLTVILRKSASVPDAVTAGLDTVGIRMPAHPVGQAFLSACGGPVAAPSANISGRPSPTTSEAVLADLDGRVPCVLRGGRSPVGLESTVVDCSGPEPLVLRAGAVSLEDLREVDPRIRPARDDDEGFARSPGMKYRHYSPRARVVLTDRAPEHVPLHEAFIGLEGPSAMESPFVNVCGSVEEYAHELFHFFRRCDEAGVRVVHCGTVPETGLGMALMDRLRRAAADR